LQEQKASAAVKLLVEGFMVHVPRSAGQLTPIVPVAPHGVGILMFLLSCDSSELSIALALMMKIKANKNNSLRENKKVSLRIDIY
jgi:hypothetical protein